MRIALGENDDGSGGLVRFRKRLEEKRGSENGQGGEAVEATLDGGGEEMWWSATPVD